MKIGKEGSKRTRWYDLFSRGARDWLRHSEKVRASIREQLPELISKADIVRSEGSQRLRVPIRFLEHFRFKLNDDMDHFGVGQGAASPGDILRPAQRPGGDPNKRSGGNESGGIEFVLELTIDDIVDWLWEELRLPYLQNKQGGVDDDEYTREGWDRRGARSRLDRRRSLKESIKRRAVVKGGPAIIDDDLRFRQLIRRDRPAEKAVVFFVMDVSASMTQRDRQLAKTFFFWVVQGLRRQYRQLDCVFIAHTERAWQFDEQQFFEVKGTGGTAASSAFNLMLKSIADDYPPAGYNIYLFYASDGDNFSEDRDEAAAALSKICNMANYSGFVEIVTSGRDEEGTEMAKIFKAIEQKDDSVATYFLRNEAAVWDAIKAFFQQSVDTG
ncbi:MAG: DUF444 family protein [Gammaproteobacteria bacterium]|nr:DUF444 family protein [Gammaproteobacteria bacterium]